MSGALAHNVMHFARLLRGAGFAVGAGQTLTALTALRAIDIRNRDDVYWALHAVFVDKHARSDLFRRAFKMFWAAEPADAPREAQDHSIGLAVDQPESALQRATDGKTSSVREDEAANEFAVTLSWSAAEQLRSKDFEAMTADEKAEARRLLSTLRLPIPVVPTRRFRRSYVGSEVDMRGTLRTMVRDGGMIELRRRRRVLRHPPLVVLCDISGSMASYVRMLLHFLHVITTDRDRVHTFLFGTRLTNVSREMKQRDPDYALMQVSRAAQDWSGGTRIGQTLADFNRLWARRVLGQGAVVLLITDGLDRDGGAGLEVEMARLQRSCRRLIWLNPLLRYDAFEPKSAGIRAMLPYVDDFRPAHNLNSLAQLANALTAPAARRAPQAA